MNYKNQLRIFQRALARIGLHCSAWIVAHLPFRAVQWMSFILVTIGFQFTIRQKRIAYESLEIAFGQEKSPEQIKQIIKQCFSNLGRGMVEMFYYLSHPKTVERQVTVEGIEHLKAALDKGNGVVAVTAHFGNFPLMMLYFALQEYKTSCVIRPTRDQKLEEYLFRRRTEVGLNTIYAIPRKQCVEQSLKILRNNELLFIPLDQNFGSGGGVFVDFFGQKAATATGPVVFARRTGAVILPMFIIREEHDQHKIIIEKPVEIEEKENDDATMEHNIGKITGQIERYIRKYPHEWGWMHRRWKSRPSSETKTVASD